MAFLTGFIFMLMTSLSKGHNIDCAAIACDIPQCENGYYTPDGYCCPICRPGKAGICPNSTGMIGTCVELCSIDSDCPGTQKCCSNGCGHTCQTPLPDCTTVLCAKPNCDQFYTPVGQCCPVCGIDCSLVRCAMPICFHGHYTPEGQCCTVCKPDCSLVDCATPICSHGLYTPEGNCCPICKPETPGTCPKPMGAGICVELCSGDHDCPDNQKCCSNGCGHTCQQPLDCSTVLCAKPPCNNYYTPDGKCCPICRPDCSAVLCVRPNCADPFTPEGECCPVCPDVCSGFCGGIAGFQCPDGKTCKLEGNFPDAGGKCCPVEPEPKPIKACLQPRKLGTCFDAFPRYFYNTETCQCEFFTWKGCQSNDNNFLSLAHCQASCEIPMKSNPVCELPKITGPCKALMPRWFYNSTSCKCEGFNYGGCGANGNNFLTEDWCKTNCGCHECGVCNLPLNPQGAITCLAYMPSYGYNSTSCKCEKFIYGGCGGNANRFGTLEQCEKRCKNADCEPMTVCDKPADPGPCEALIPRYFYNTKTCECEQFNWGGCDGNENNFQTIKDCLKACRGFNTCDKPEKPNCQLPKDTGPCRALMERFYYDPLDCKCKKFNYGGCKGNSNNFASQGLCEKSCGNTLCTACNQTADPGPCKGSFERFFFNVQTCQCETFIYGGCGGNGNRYETLHECQAACGSFPCSVCSQPMKVGPCRAAIKRFYYDPQTNKCKRFSWGGCQANGNNFKNKRLCNKVCKISVCTLPVKAGSCYKAIKRYYYDAATGKCKKFSWTGCDKNGNNFRSRKACRRRCY